MCDIVVNDVFDELREENNRLSDDLSFEKKLNQILEKIKTLAIILKNNCICSDNIEVFRQLNDLEIDYKLVKANRIGQHGQQASKGILENALLFERLNTRVKDDVKTSDVVTATQTGSHEPDNTEDPDVYVHTFTCNECQIRFGSASDLQLHINYLHSKTEEIKKVVPKQPLRTITDYLQPYKRDAKTDSSNIKSKADNGMNKDFNFMSEMMQKNKQKKNKKKKKPLSGISLIRPNQTNHLCSECGLVFTTQESFRNHMRKSHKNLRPFKCDFDGCDLAYTKKSHLHEHQKKKHHPVQSDWVSSALAIGLNGDIPDVNTPAEEEEADKSISPEPIIKVKSEPEDIKPDVKFAIGCEMTMVKAKTETVSEESEEESPPKESLALSVVVNDCVNSDETTKYCCDLCPFSASNPFDLNKHRVTHSPKIYCEICGKAYSSKNSLGKHRRAVHNFFQRRTRPTVTAVSPQAMPTKSPEKPREFNGVDELQCDKCPYRTTKRYHMKTHALCHSTVRPFKCCVKECKFAAKRRDILNKHIRRIHHLISFPNQYVCKVQNCNLRFANDIRLRQHISAHKNKFICRWSGCQFRTDTFAKLMVHKRKELHIKPEHM